VNKVNILTSLKNKCEQSILTLKSEGTNVKDSEHFNLDDYWYKM